MKNYVIMFQGGVETQEFFSKEMARTFEAHGYTVYWFDLVLSVYSARALRRFYGDHPAARFTAFTFNFNGIAGEDGLYGGEYRTGNFWDDEDVHVYNMVVDHPLYYHKYLHLRPQKYTQLSIDRNHIRYMQRFYPSVDLGGRLGFVPLGGTEVNAGGRVIPGRRYLPVEARPVDVIFTGNYTPPEKFEKYIAHMEPVYRDFYRGLVQAAISAPDQLIETLAEQKLTEALTESGEELTDGALAGCMPNMMFVDLSVRFYFRAAVIGALADGGVKVHTVGAGWNLLKCRHPEMLVCEGNMDSQRCLDRISQSKISVNVMPWFKDGAHDRIFNSVLNGAVCVSDKSRYLEEVFEGEKELLFYDLTDFRDLAGRVQNLLCRPEQMRQMADRAYEKCNGRHTWANRTEQILALMEPAE